MKRVKITAHVDIENVYIYVDDDATNEDIDNDVKFYVDQRLFIDWNKINKKEVDNECHRE